MNDGKDVRLCASVLKGTEPEQAARRARRVRRDRRYGVRRQSERIRNLPGSSRHGHRLVAQGAAQDSRDRPTSPVPPTRNLEEPENARGRAGRSMKKYSGSAKELRNYGGSPRPGGSARDRCGCGPTRTYARTSSPATWPCPSSGRRSGRCRPTRPPRPCRATCGRSTAPTWTTAGGSSTTGPTSPTRPSRSWARGRRAGGCAPGTSRPYSRRGRRSTGPETPHEKHSTR